MMRTDINIFIPVTVYRIYARYICIAPFLVFNFHGILLLQLVDSWTHIHTHDREFSKYIRNSSASYICRRDLSTLPKFLRVLFVGLNPALTLHKPLPSVHSLYILRVCRRSFAIFLCICVCMCIYMCITYYAPRLVRFMRTCRDFSFTLNMYQITACKYNMASTLNIIISSTRVDYNIRFLVLLRFLFPIMYLNWTYCVKIKANFI